MILYLILGLIALIAGVCLYYRKPIIKWVTNNKKKAIVVATISVVLGGGGLLYDWNGEIPEEEPIEDNCEIYGRGETYNTYYNSTSQSYKCESVLEYINYQNETGIFHPINTTFEMLDSEHFSYQYGYRAYNNKGVFDVYLKPNANANFPIAYAYNKGDNLSNTHILRSGIVGVGYYDPSTNHEYSILQTTLSSVGSINCQTISYSNIFSGTNLELSYHNSKFKEELVLSNTTKTLLQNNPPSDFGYNNANSYLVVVTELDYENIYSYNGTTNITSNFTFNKDIIFKDKYGGVLFSFINAFAYEQNNISNIENMIMRIVHKDGHTYLLTGIKATTLNSMVFPVVFDPSIEKHPGGTGDTYNDWTNPANAYSNLGTYATVSATNANQDYYGFDFSSIPSYAQITDIEFVCWFEAIDCSPIYDTDLLPELTWNDYGGETTNGVFILGPCEYGVGFRSVGGLWGRSWESSELSPSNFRLHINVTDVPSGATVKVYSINLTITYSYRPVINTFSVEGDGENDYDLDGNNLRMKWTTTDLDTDDICLYFTYNVGSAPSNPTVASSDYYDASDDQATYKVCAWNDTSGWVNTGSTVYIKAIAYDGAYYSVVKSDTIPGIDSQAPGSPTNIICRDNSYAGGADEWDNDGTIYLTWTSATDSHSGIQLYYAEIGDNTPDEDAGNDNQDTDTYTGADGEITYYIRAKDNAGNLGAVVSDTIKVDTADPTSQVDAIGLGSYPQTLAGNSSDTYSAISATTITIHDTTDGDYYTGSGWGSSTPLVTSPDSVSGIWKNWTYDSSGISWEYGDTYQIIATSQDNAGNTKVSSTVTFTIPNIQFTSIYPQDSATDILTHLQQTYATISDAVTWNITLRDADFALLEYTTGGIGDGIKYLNLSTDPFNTRYSTIFCINMTAINGSVTQYSNTSFTTCDGSGFVTISNTSDFVDVSPSIYQYVKAVSKDMIYVTAWEDGLHVYNRTVSETLNRLDQDRNLSTGGSNYRYFSLDYNDTLVVVGCLSDEGLCVYENSTTLTCLNSSYQGKSVYSVSMNETLIACAFGLDGWGILSWSGGAWVEQNVTDPGSINITGIYLDETNSRIYMTTTTNGLRVYDYSYASKTLTNMNEWTTVGNLGINNIEIDTDGNIQINTNSGMMEFSYDGSTLTRNDVDNSYNDYYGMCLLGKYILATHGDTGKLSASIHAGGLINVEKDVDISKSTSTYTNYTRGIATDGVHLYICGQQNLFIHGFDLAPVAEPTIDIISAGVPGADDSIFNNCTYNPESYCNITATIEVPEERYFGRYQYGSGDDTYVTLAETTGALGYDLSGTMMAACKFKCTYTSVDYSTISAYVTFLGSDNANLSFAVYNDSNGAPHTKLSEANDTWRALVSTYRENYDRWMYAAYWPDTSHRWATLNLESNVTLYEGNTYWLVAACNDTYNDNTGVGWPPGNNQSYSNDFHDYFCIQGNDEGGSQNVVYTYYEVPANCTFPATWPTISNHKGRPLDDVECTMSADYYYMAWGDWYKEDYYYRYVNEPQPDAFSPESYKLNWLVANAVGERCIFNTTLVDKTEYSGKTIHFVNITVCTKTENVGNKFTLGVRNSTISWGSEYTFGSVDTHYNVTSSWATNPFTSNPWTWKDIENLSIVYNCSSYSTGDLHLNQMFVTVNSDGDFIHQGVNTMCIYVADTNVTDLPVTIDTATVQWYNYSNATWCDYSMTQIGATNNWTYNVTNLDGGNWYSFNITCIDNFGNEELYEHYRLLKEGVTERIQFQCGVTPDVTQLGYNNETVIYFMNASYDDTPLIFGDTENLANNLNHEQGCDGSWHDTGYWSGDFFPGDHTEERYCSFFTGGWFDTNTTFDGDGSWEWDNIYLHCYVASGESYDSTKMRWGRANTAFNPGFIKENNLGEFDGYIMTNDTRRDSLKLDASDMYTTHNDWLGSTTFWLEAGLHNVTLSDETFDSNSIYELVVYFEYDGTDTYGASGFVNTHIVCNRSYLSFAILNVPNNATLNESHSDTDGDGLSDWTELYVTWTHPFLDDTDGDGITDYWEYQNGTNPNDYLNRVQTTIREDGVDYFVWMGDTITASALNTILTTEGCSLTDSGEYIAKWNTSGVWNNDANVDGLWYKYIGADGSGHDFSVNTFDVIKINLDDSGTQTIWISQNISVNYSATVNQTLEDNSTQGKGYNYWGWLKDVDTTLSTINSTVGLSNGTNWTEAIAMWNETTYTWNYWFPGLPTAYNTDKAVLYRRVLMFKIANVEKYIDTADF